MVLTPASLAPRFVNRLKNDKDLVVAVTGDEGDGKSTLAALIADEADPAFDLERNILYSPQFEEMKNKVKGLPPYSAIVADEAIKALYKLHWQSKLQQYINILYAICRSENKLSILCMPRFSDFTEFFRNHRIKFWIHIIDAISRNKEVGHAVVFTKSWNPFSLDPWNFKEMQKIIDKYGKEKKLKESEFSLTHKRHILSRSRNYVGVMEFGKMPDDMFHTYSQLKNRNAYEDMKIPEEKKSKRLVQMEEQRMTAVQRLSEKGFSHKEIAQTMGVTPQRVSQWLLIKQSETRKPL